MKETIILDRKEAEELIAVFDQRVTDKEEALKFPVTDAEEAAIRLLTDKLAGRIS